ncbi:MAG TPA: hypothetical protein VGM12_25315 [Trebonia sp.]|jgi:hypothetical protein
MSDNELDEVPAELPDDAVEVLRVAVLAVLLAVLLEGAEYDDAAVRWLPLAADAALCDVVEPCAADDPSGMLTVSPAKIRLGLAMLGFADSTAARLAPWLAAIPERVSPG